MIPKAGNKGTAKMGCLVCFWAVILLKRTLDRRSLGLVDRIFAFAFAYTAVKVMAQI